MLDKSALMNDKLALMNDKLALEQALSALLNEQGELFREKHGLDIVGVSVEIVKDTTVSGCAKSSVIAHVSLGIEWYSVMAFK